MFQIKNYLHQAQENTVKHKLVKTHDTVKIKLSELDLPCTISRLTSDFKLLKFNYIYANVTYISKIPKTVLK